MCVHFELVLMACVLHHMWASPSLSLSINMFVFTYIHYIEICLCMWVCFCLKSCTTKVAFFLPCSLQKLFIGFSLPGKSLGLVHQGLSSPWNTPLHASEFADNPDCDDLLFGHATHPTRFELIDTHISPADSVHGRVGVRIGKLLSGRVLTFPLVLGFGIFLLNGMNIFSVKEEM